MTRPKLSLVAFVALVVVTACGTDARQKTLQTSLTALNAASQGFAAWDAEHQKTIVARATSFEQGRADLNAYRLRRERVLLGFQVAYTALAAAALDPGLGMVLEAAQAVQTLYTLITQLKAGEPFEPPEEAPR